MDTQHTQTDSKGAFFIEQDGKRIAEMTYSIAGADKIIIDHTEVDPRLKGQGVGKKLVLAAVAFARETKIKILPLCPFVRAIFNKTPAIRDVQS